jgi:hypothetical protein
MSLDLSVDLHRGKEKNIVEVSLEIIPFARCLKISKFPLALQCMDIQVSNLILNFNFELSLIWRGGIETY